MKFKKPELFSEKIRPFCSPYTFPKGIDLQSFLDLLKKYIETFPEYAHLAEKATNFLKRDTPTTYREPWASLTHFDLWVNNILNRKENGTIVQNKFVDFQTYDYRSPASDVFFYIWTSVQKPVLEKHLDSLIKHYHQVFVGTLEGFKLDTSAFSYDKFLEEIRLEADFEFGHALLFVYIVKAVKNLEQRPAGTANMSLDDLSSDLRDFVYFMVSECSKRNWL